MRVSEVFSLDGSQDPLDMLPGFFLLTDHRSLVSLSLSLFTSLSSFNK